MTRARLVAPLLSALLLTLWPVVALAQGAPAQPLAQPPEFAAVRARYEPMTAAQIAAAGYEADPVCISSPAGGMGFHAVNRRLFQEQVLAGKVDPSAPPILLLEANKRVVGLEWEAVNTGQPAPVLFDQTVPLLPGHPGLEEPHYMLHAYFRPNGQVLFSVFDPQLTCPGAPGGVAAPGTLPRAGSGGAAGADGTWLLVPAAAGLLLGLGGVAVWTVSRRTR